jgi:hypothetical protein
MGVAYEPISHYDQICEKVSICLQMPPGMSVSLCYSFSSFTYLLCISQSVDVFPNAFQHISNDVSQILIVRLINLNLGAGIHLEMIHMICSVQT